MKYIKEIVYIILFSIVIAIAYNMTLPKPLPLIREKMELSAVDDNLLFADDSTNHKIEETAKSNKDSINLTNSKMQLTDSTAKTNTKSDSILLAQKSIHINDKEDKQKVIDAHQNLSKTVTYQQMLKIMNDKSFILIDARSPENYSKDRIANAINIFPYGDESEMMNKIMDLPFDKKIVVYCDGGSCDASHKLAEIIISFGYDKVFVYTGGWEEWTTKYKKNK